MGMEIASSGASDVGVEGRPSILLVGSAATGKASILNRLRKNDHASLNISSSGVTCYGWKIDTKYYTANVGIWMATLEQAQEEESMRLLSLSSHCEALVMVFDLSNDSSFECVKNWATRMNLSEFDILLCVGNKADRVPEHYAHVEYRRRLQRRGERGSDLHPEFSDFGIQRSEGSALLSDAHEEAEVRAESSAVCGKRQQRVAWCIENGIEYIEACAINEAFDECLSLDGDLQGVSRVQGALSAHMWQGMVMKPSTGRSEDVQHQGSSSDEDSEFNFEYELLGNGSGEEEAFGGNETVENGSGSGSGSNGDAVETVAVEQESGEEPVVAEQVGEEVNREVEASALTSRNGREDSRVDEFEHLMQEMAGIRENLQSMPDTQRRELASQIAMRMANMFMDDDEE